MTSSVASKPLSTFRAVHASGLLVPSQAAVTALSLLFERVHLPRNIELVSEFARKFRFASMPSRDDPRFKISIAFDDADPLFGNLTEKQQWVAEWYLFLGLQSAIANQELFGPVFETKAFDAGAPFRVQRIKKGARGTPHRYRVTLQPMELTEDEDDNFENLIGRGYVPVATSSYRTSRVSKGTATEVAALLAMKSVLLVLPATSAARPADILEARSRLRDHLPPFWSAMLRMSVDLREAASQGMESNELHEEAQWLLQTVVRPAVIDLKAKIEKERRQWFHRILGPVRKAIQVAIGNPLVSQQQLLLSSLALASEVATTHDGHLRRIAALKQDAGLTYLLELDAGIGRRAKQKK